MRVLCPGLLLFLFALPPSAAAMDLLEAYRLARAHDAEFAAARATRDAEREQMPQARAGLLPSLTLSGESAWNAREIDNGANRVDRGYNSHQHTLTLTQPVFRWQNLMAYAQGKTAAALAEARFVEAGQQLSLRVSSAYFDVLNALANLEAARAQKLAIAQQLEQARQNFEVGAATIVDAVEAESRHDLAEAQEIASENELEIQREALRVMIGDAPELLARLDAQKAITPPQPAQMSVWVEAAQAHNLGVQVAAHNADIAEKEIARAKAGRYPTLDLVASGGRSRTQDGSGLSRPRTEANSVGLQLNLPLFSGGGISSKAREAAANHQAALSLLEAARRNAALSARQNFLGVVNGLAQIRALEAALASSLTSLEHNKTGYEVGVRINIDVLNAEQQVFTTRRDLARAYHDTLLARLRLKAAIGALDESDLIGVNALLQSRESAAGGGT
ncbi:MAG: TolC family outer membrane protein [Zoogloeaceae bacterium]|jgi:outer membrane protein|nr:TolC family outer membrane protein [Zoogloeaceae bacterium]